MRRTPLRRSAPLTNGGQRSPQLTNGGQLRRTPLRARSPSKSDQALQDEAWAEKVWARDRGECQAGPHGNPAQRVAEVECRGRRDPHHIFPKGTYPELRHQVDNGVTLCRAHHDWVHFQEPAKARQLGLKGEEVGNAHLEVSDGPSR